jgi:hypothetical protein
MVQNGVMISIRTLGLTVAAALALAPPIRAQGAGSIDEGQICLSVAHHWGGSFEDLRQIEFVPVPRSFREAFESGGCRRFQLVESSLLNWHLAFGNEQSATAALAYIEDGYSEGRPPPGEFRQHLTRTWQAALRAIEAARLPPAYGPERTAATRRLWTNRSVRGASDLIAAHDDFIDLTQQYLGAAEYYESPALLAKAQNYWPAVQAGLEILFRGARVANADFEAEPSDLLQAHTYRINQIHDIDMRLAILRARLSRTPTDIDSAAVVMRRNFDSVLATAEQNAQEHSGEICEFHGDAQSGDLKALEQACDEENSLAVRTVNFWRNRAHLDLLMAGDPEHYEVREQQRREDGSTYARRATSGGVATRGWVSSFETAEQLLTGGTSRGIHDRWEELPLLLLARSELHARLAHALAASTSPRDADEQTEMALDYLAEAAQVTPAHRRPALYRRIASTYLRLWDTPAGSDGRSGRRSADRIRLAVLFRTTIASLEAITLGRDEARH